MLDIVSDSFALRFLIAVVLVGLGLAGFFIAVAYIRRRNPGMAFLGQSGARHKRLSIVESIALDGRRRVVIVRRDDMEHLLLLGGAGDLVVEQGIEPLAAAEGAAQEDNLRDRDANEEKKVPVHETARKPEPAPSPPPQAAPRGDGDLGLRYIRSWEDDEGPRADAPLMPARVIEVPSQPDKTQRLPDEQPVATVRPVTLSRSERPLPQTATPARPAVAELSPEEAALARELEAARRRGSGSISPTAPPAERPPIGFDRVLEQEMQEQLETVRRNARSQTAPGEKKDAPSTQSRREIGELDQTSPRGALARLFGGTGTTDDGREG